MKVYKNPTSKATLLTIKRSLSLNKKKIKRKNAKENQKETTNKKGVNGRAKEGAVA